MYQYAHNGMRFRAFVKEQNNEDQPKAVNNTSKYLAPKPLTGEEAKEFYETMVKDSCPKEKQRKLKPVPKPKKNTLERNIFKDSDLLWMAQNNDIKNLTYFFSQKQNSNANITDEYGWTPLMCASCSGAELAVEILLKNGADLFKCDRFGNNALTLAKQRNNAQIVKILENFGVKTEEEEKQIKDESPVDFFCATCKENIKMDRNKHESSVLHLFNCKIKTQTFYGIPESNKGFQLLLREGWNKEKGLGVDGKGRKFPVKAIMKKGRAGIGAAPPRNTSDTRVHTLNYENKKRAKYRRWKDKSLEKNFRMEFC